MMLCDIMQYNNSGQKKHNSELGIFCGPMKEGGQLLQHSIINSRPPSKVYLPHPASSQKSHDSKLCFLWPALYFLVFAGEHDAEEDRVGQREKQEREKFGEDTGSAIIEDLSEFGHHAEPDTDDSWEDPFPDDISFVSALNATPPAVRGNHHLRWAPGVRGGNDHPLSNQALHSGGNDVLVASIRSLEKTLQTHCRLLTRRLKREKPSSTSSHHRSTHGSSNEPSRATAPTSVVPGAPSTLRPDKVRHITIKITWSYVKSWCACVLVWMNPPLQLNQNCRPPIHVIHQNLNVVP